MIINKYKLYIAIVLILLSTFIIPQLFRVLTFEKTVAVVSGVKTKHSLYGKYTHTNNYPVIYFETGAKKVRFYAPSFMHEMLIIGKPVDVIYNREVPEVAYVNSFYGLWGLRLILFFPLFLFCTACTFSIDLLPTQINLFSKKKRLKTQATE